MRPLIGCALLCAASACRQAPPAAPPQAEAQRPAAGSAAPDAGPKDAGLKDAAPPAPRPAAEKPSGERVTLIFSSSVAGQLVPCGCSPDQRGGLPRAVSLVGKLRKQDPDLLFIDAGDLLFENAARPPAQLLTQKQLKARTLAAGDELLGAAARAVGQRDLSLGAQFAVETAGKVPLLDAGVAPVPGARASLLAQAGQVKVGLFAAGFEQDAAATISARAKGLRAEGARLVVLLLHPRGDNSFTAAQALLPAARAAGVDLVVLGRRDDPATDPNRKDAGPPLLVAVEGHGQSLVRVDAHLGKGPLVLAAGAEDRNEELKALDARIDRFRAQVASAPERKQQLEAKIKELEDRRKALAAAPVEKPAEGASWAQATFLPLTQEAGSDPAAQKLVEAYDEKVSALNLAEAKTQPASCPAPARGELAFTGASSCVSCHQDAAAFWAQTKHAHAYDTLVNVKKQFSLDCVTCHVTGWQQPGGVCRIDRTEFGSPGLAGRGVGRRDVQCESCHGPGSAHVKDPPGNIRLEVPSTTCTRCHEPANSPHFDDAKYRPFIVGPGHGQPLAKGQRPGPREGGPQH
jgi:hypothetical protein